MPSKSVVYQETIFNYYVGIPLFVILILSFLMLIAGNTHFAIFLPFLVVTFLFVHLFTLKIKVDHHQLQFILGLGWIKKAVFIKDLDLSLMEEASIPWYLKGTVFKFNAKGNLIFAPMSGKALILKEKKTSTRLLVVSKDNSRLFEVLKTQQIKN